MKPMIKKIVLAPNKALIVAYMTQGNMNKDKLVVFYSKNKNHFVRLMDTDLMGSMKP